MQTYNRHVIVLFTLQAMICIIAAFTHGFIYATTTTTKDDVDDTTPIIMMGSSFHYWYGSGLPHLTSLIVIRYLYVGPQSVDAGDVVSRGLRVAGSLLLQFTYFVPISLLVFPYLCTSLTLSNNARLHWR